MVIQQPTFNGWWKKKWKTTSEHLAGQVADQLLIYTYPFTIAATCHCSISGLLKIVGIHRLLLVACVVE